MVNIVGFKIKHVKLFRLNSNLMQFSSVKSVMEIIKIECLKLPSPPRTFFLKHLSSREGLESTPQSSGEQDSEDDDTDLFVNTNRITYDFMESEESSDSEEEEK